MRVPAVAHGVGSFLLVLAAGYLCLLLLIYLLQAKLLYFPSVGGQHHGLSPTDVGLEYQQVELITEDGVRLHGWYLPAENESATLLFCHGNAGTIAHRLDSLLLFHRLGCSVLIYDYRGYGKSEGRPFEQGTYADAASAWNYLVTTKKKSPQEIILFGRSLGAAIAAELATRVEPGGLILESAFTSVPDLAAQLYPFLPVRLLSRFSYNTRARLAAISCPVLIIHSARDEIIPYSHAQELFAAAQQAKELLTISGGHNDGFLVSGATYTNGLLAFLQNCRKAHASSSLRNNVGSTIRRPPVTL